MDLKSTKAELDAAYAQLDQKELHIKRLGSALLAEQFVLKLLDEAGFIKEGKLDEAREIARTFLD